MTSHRPRHPLIRGLFVLLLWLPWVAQASGSGLLWKVSGAGSAPSYLFGTFHSDDPQVLHLNPAVEQAFTAARCFVMEVELTPDTLMAVAQRMYYGEGQRLSEHLPAPLFKRTVQAMARLGVPREVVERLRPWAVVITLSMPPSSGGAVLDMTLYQRALERGIPVSALESAQEQLGVFEDLSAADQLTLLRGTLAQAAEMPSVLAELKRAYLRGDLDALQTLSDRSMQGVDKALEARFNKALIDDRNRRMVGRLAPLLRQGGAFVAVGALHLPGVHGLIHLLREAGYRVEAVG